MNRRLRHVLVTLAAVGVAAGLFATAGVYNVSARVGHWPTTARFLHFMMRQSARTHALGIESPALEDPRMVIRGATYFAVGCAVCHSEPGNRFTPIVHYMTPEAPRLSPLIESWNTRELFWVVDNGIKYTGMPAWSTADRPDEVWSMVAFLTRLPELDAVEYRSLAFAPGPEADLGLSLTNLELDEKVSGTLTQCARCHGYDGMGRATGAFPYIGGQNETYLARSLESFAEANRASGIMQPIAAGLDEETLDALARHYAGVDAPAEVRGAPAADGNAERGAEIALTGLPEQRVPACRHCHGPGRIAANSIFPRLAGQNFEYLVTQLDLWRAGTRGGTDWAPIMATVAEELEDADIRDVAAFYASLPWIPDAANAAASAATRDQRGPAATADDQPVPHPE
jgi:cytochrome c553